MSDLIMNARIQHKRDTDENFKINNPILLSGELAIIDKDNSVKIKVGDGSSAYNDLNFLNVGEVLSVNGSTGDVLINVPVTSVDGKIGDVLLDSEIWTFTLDDGSIITKKMVVK